MSIKGLIVSSIIIVFLVKKKNTLEVITFTNSIFWYFKSTINLGVSHEMSIKVRHS